MCKGYWEANRQWYCKWPKLSPTLKGKHGRTAPLSLCTCVTPPSAQLFCNTGVMIMTQSAPLQSVSSIYVQERGGKHVLASLTTGARAMQPPAYFQHSAIYSQNYRFLSLRRDQPPSFAASASGAAERVVRGDSQLGPLEGGEGLSVFRTPNLSLSRCENSGYRP